MSQIEPPDAGSPFDRIRREDERGEYWLARELMPLLGYDQWRRFEDAIQRAIASARNAGVDIGAAFAQVNQLADAGNLGHQQRRDYRLTRYAAYLIAMNGDPRKPEIAAAQTYFAVKTRQAEVTPQPVFALPDMATPEGRLQVAEMLLAGARREVELVSAVSDRDAQLAIAGPKAEYVDAYVGSDDACTIRILANQLQVGERDLRQWLMDRKVIYRQVIGSRWSHSKQRHVTEYAYHPYAERKEWFRIGDQPNAPRLHNDQLRTTLYVTPMGKVGIKRLLMRHPLDGAAA